MNQNYKFYSNKNVTDIKPVDEDFKFIKNPFDLYNLLLEKGWAKDTCAPRMRIDYENCHKTLGQCSITSFLVQDIFGGEVYGVPLGDGNFHCFNKINDVIFDLTSEQFSEKGINLDYSLDYPQERKVHFLKEEKYHRYLLLKNRVLNH